MCRIFFRCALLTVGLCCAVHGPAFAGRNWLSQPSAGQQLYEQAKALEGRGQLVEAQELYQQILKDHPDFESVEEVQKSLEHLNIAILTSDVPTPESVMHVVDNGETLQKIARKYNTTVELIKIRNHLTSDLIRVGQKLSVFSGALSILVYKSQNYLLLKDGDRVVKTYAVSTGKSETTTPVGMFTIKDRMTDPVWFRPGKGAVLPGTPENHLGTRWLGFNIPQYGIHGTVDPQLIGQSVSHGCVRMRNTDVEELYNLVPAGTKVQIVE